MKRKLLTAVLVAALLLSLVSCDAVVNLMGKMGNNVSGVDTAQVENAVKSVTVKEENKTKMETSDKKTIDEKEVKDASTFTYTDENGENKELYTVGTTGDGNEAKNVIGIGESLIELPTDSTVDFKDVKSVLPPQDISSISENLSGSNKDETLKMLGSAVEDESTKEAAEGTKIVVQALLETADSLIDDDTEDETEKKTKEIIDQVLGNINNKENELTLGDVVVLQALTNLITEAPDAVAEVVKSSGSSNDSTGGEGEAASSSSDATVNLLDAANDAIVETAVILNTVSSSTTIFEGIDLTKLVDLVLGASGSGSSSEGN